MLRRMISAQACDWRCSQNTVVSWADYDVRNSPISRRTMLSSPPVNDIDVWRAANLLIQQHGEEAELAAAGRIEDMIAAGDGLVQVSRLTG